MAKTNSKKDLRRGVLITFEGIDGSGKSTQAQLLRDYLEKTNIPYVFVREPGGVKIAEEVRRILLDGKNLAMHPRTELLLFLAARSELVDKVISPALSSGRVVVSDRYADSTFAYQIDGRGLPGKIVKELNSFACAKVKPDLTFLVDLDVKSAGKRLLKQKDRMESAELAFHERVRKGFLKIAHAEPARVKILDGHLSQEEIWQTVRTTSQRLLARKHIEPAR